MSKVFLPGEPLTAADVNEYLVNKPFEYRAGTVTIPSGSGGVNVTVTFSTPFPAGVIPAIEITVTHPKILHWRWTSKDENGFTARFDRQSGDTYRFDYIALPPR